MPAAPRRTKEQQSTWSLVATVAVLVLAIMIILLHVLSRSVVEDPIDDGAAEPGAAGASMSSWFPLA
jgi:hypothetical protein